MRGRRRGLVRWLDPPPAGTRVCGGFDGASVDDWTAIKLETVDGLLFTPRYGRDARPTAWNPADWGGRTPRGEVQAAWEEINDRYLLERVYLDPPHFGSEIAAWQQQFGDDVFIPWETYRAKQMFDALELFFTDITSGTLTHDGCPVTTLHIGNARTVGRSGKYGLDKASKTQKIDAGVTSVLAHKAAVDARASGWGHEEPVDTRVFCFT